MLDYDNESRRRSASERADWLAVEMRRGRRLTPDQAGHTGRARLGELLRRAAHLGRAKEPESSVPAFDA
jgi:hypothetical protein